jgi:hypothetical protein
MARSDNECSGIPSREGVPVRPSSSPVQFRAPPGRLRKDLRWGVAALAVAAAGLATYIAFAPLPRYPPHPLTLTLEATPARLARGKQLANMLCLQCHLDPETGVATGKRMAEVPPAFGVAYPANVTQDESSGIGGWTDGQLVAFLRTGVTRDGRFVPVWMPASASGASSTSCVPCGPASGRTARRCVIRWPPTGS